MPSFGRSFDRANGLLFRSDMHVSEVDEREKKNGLARSRGAAEKEEEWVAQRRGSGEFEKIR